MRYLHSSRHAESLFHLPVPDHPTDTKRNSLADQSLLDVSDDYRMTTGSISYDSKHFYEKWSGSSLAARLDLSLYISTVAHNINNNVSNGDWFVSKMTATIVTEETSSFSSSSQAGSTNNNHDNDADYQTLDGDYVRSSYLVTLATAFAILFVIVVTVIFNLFAFVVFVTRVNKRRSKNIYLANLSMIDMLIGLVIMPLKMAILINPAWNLPGVSCRTFLTVLHSFIYISLLGVVLVSIDRWYSICYPFTYRVRPSGRIAFLAVFFSWIFSFAFHIPFVALSDKTFQYNWPELTFGPCRVSSKQHSFTVVLFTIVKFLIPHVAMLVLKISLYKKIKQRKLSNVRRSFGSFDCGALALIRTSISETAMNTLIEASNSAQNGGTWNNCLLSATGKTSRKRSCGLTRQNTMELITLRQGALARRNTGSRSGMSRSWSGSPDQRASLSVPVLGRRMSLQEIMMPSNMKSTVKNTGFSSGRGVNGRRGTVGDLAKRLLEKQDSKAVWYLSLLLAVSVICWTPLTVVYIVHLHRTCPLWLEEMVVWILLINSTANPFLYGLLNKEFRKVLGGWFRVRTSKMKRLQLALRLLSFQVALGAIDFQGETREEVNTSRGNGGGGGGGFSTCPGVKGS